jgi:hypothetical protein
MLVIQLESVASEGLRFWHHRESWPELTRRLALRYDVRVESPSIVLTYVDGRQAHYSSKLLAELRHVESMNIQRSVDEIKIADGPLDDFSVELPPIYINNERLVIPTIHFKLDKATYMPVVNC